MEKEKNLYDIVVVGGGPAGLTAALYGARGGRKTLVIEKAAAGGQLAAATEIENYPGVPKVGGYELAEVMRRQAAERGAAFVSAEAAAFSLTGKIKKITAGGVTYAARAVILCMGAAPRKLGIAREEELAGRGVSYCAACDGAFFRGRAVAVAGGGNSAAEEALYLSDLAAKVTLVHRRAAFRASPALTERLAARPHIETALESEVVALRGGDKVEGVVIKNAAGQVREIPAAALFVAIGRAPSTQALGGAVKLTAEGYVKVKSDMSTNIKGVYAAGDITDKYLRQVVTAAADGAVSAEAALHFLTAQG